MRLKLRGIPKGAAPVFSWHGAKSNLATYWGWQDVTVEVVAHIPKSWKTPGDGFWRVTGRSAEGTPIHFLGVVQRFRNENGTEIAVVVPRFELDRAPDGLYFVLEPNVQIKAGRLAAIRPVAILVEVRNHAWQPFRVKFPLMPDHDSPITPQPEKPPETPAGTPIPVD